MPALIPSDATVAPARERYWDWFAVALFLLLTVDLLMSMGAAMVYGIEAEANPLMRWLLAQGFATIVLAHVGALLLAATGFHLLLAYADRLREPSRTRFLLSTELWLGFLVAAGLGIYANNLMVIVLGESLF